MTPVSHLDSASDATRLSARTVLAVHAGRPSFVRDDPAAPEAAISIGVVERALAIGVRDGWTARRSASTPGTVDRSAIERTRSPGLPGG